MISPSSTAENRLRVYSLFVEGRAASTISQITGIDEGNVSRIKDDLVREGFLVHIKKTKRPKLYEKGPRGPELDAMIVDGKLSSYARGVTPATVAVTKKSAYAPTARVHHLKYKLKVNQEGEAPFLHQYFDRRNVKRYKGQIPYRGTFVSVELERTPSKLTMYIYPPEMDLTADELDHYEDKAEAVVMEISNYMSKHLGWKFGLPELTNWQHHIGIDSPASMGQLAGKYCMTSDDGSATLSNSEGRDEMEFQGPKAPKLAKVWLELPGKVMMIETTLNGLADDLKQLTDCMVQAKNAMIEMAQIHGIVAKQDAVDIAKRLGGDHDGAYAKDDSTKNDDGGMYR